MISQQKLSGRPLILDRAAGLKLPRILLGVAIAAVSWAVFAPGSLGGQYRPLQVRGASMEPAFAAGDLVLIKSRNSYEIGDVAAYRSGSLNATLLHRIVDVEDGSFVFQGDANDFVDSDRPTEQSIMGEVVLHVPGAGRLLSLMPALMVVVAASSFTLKRRRGTSLALGNRATRTGHTALVTSGRTASSVAFAVAGSFAILAVPLALAGPTATATQIPFEEQGSFSYRALTPKSIYLDGVADEGETIFVSISDSVQIGFRYEIRSESALDVSGTIRILATLDDAFGWRRSFVVAGKKSFEGESVIASGSLDLNRIIRIKDRLAESTGVHRGTYRLEIHPRINGHVQGPVDATPIKFAPTLSLELDASTLRYVAPVDASADPLRPRQVSALQGPEAMSPPVVSALGLRANPRMLALCLMFAALGSVVFGVVYRRESETFQDPIQDLRARVASRLVPLDSVPPWNAVEVASSRGFDLILNVTESPVLELDDESGTTWFVRDGDAVFSFKSNALV